MLQRCTSIWSFFLIKKSFAFFLTAKIKSLTNRMKKSKPRLHGLLPDILVLFQKKNLLPVSVFINNLSMHKLKHRNPYLLKMNCNMEKNKYHHYYSRLYNRFKFSLI